MKNKFINDILNNAPDPILIQSEGKVVWLNSSSSKLFGLEHDGQILNQSVLNFVHPDYHKAAKERMHKVNVLRQPADDLEEYLIIRRDGSSVMVESKGEPISFEGKPSSLIFLRDISHRKALEKEIKDNEERMRFALEASQIGVWELDMQKNIVIRSSIHDNIFGYEVPLKEWSFDKFLGHVYPKDRAGVRKCFKEALYTQTKWQIEFRIIRADGQIRWLWVYGKSKAYNAPSVNRVIGIVRDITATKETEQKFIESENKFRSLFQNHLAVKLIIDPTTGDIIDANQAAAHYYGWSIGQLKQMNLSQINILTEEEIHQNLHQALNKESMVFYFQHRNAHGEIRDVEAFSSKIIISGKVYLHSIILDIAEYKAAQNRLMLLSRSVEQSPVSVLITSRDGSIEYVNPQFELTTGYTLEEIKGKHPKILRSGFHIDAFYRDMWNTILSGKEWSGELMNRKKNGQLYWEKISISPILNSKGEVTNFVSIHEDISEYKKIMEDLMIAKEKAEESDRLKLAFLANISHEIRTPMNGILGFANILKNNELSRPEQLRFLEIIEKSGYRMLETVNDLIDIANIETGQVKLQKTVFNINELLKSLYDFFLPQATEKGLLLLVNDPLDAQYATIKTDQSKLNSILTNLIRNAVKFTLEGKIEVGCRITDDMFTFYVRDTGVGIPQNRLEAIFRPFEQADMEIARKFQGSGLGLAISKAYVNMLGGEIWVESEVGHGSAFYFNIPVSSVLQRRVKEKKVETGGAGIPSLHGTTILIAEDDMYSREMIIYLLGKTGAKVVVAQDGAEAVAEFSKNPVDLVLMDIQLPKMDGIAVLKEIRKINPGIPVIAQTAYALLDDIRRFRAAGFTDCLTKPINPDNFYLIIGRYAQSNLLSADTLPASL